jgi:hypothetical protein
MYQWAWFLILRSGNYSMHYTIQVNVAEKRKEEFLSIRAEVCHSRTSTAAVATTT